MLELRREGDPDAHLYAVREAMFALDDAHLDVAIDLAHGDDADDDAPRDILIRLASIEWRGVPATLNVDGPHEFGDVDSSRPRAFIYSGFHHASVQVRLGIVALSGDTLDARIHIETDDVVRYDDAATQTTISGPIELSRADRDSFWHP